MASLFNTSESDYLREMMRKDVLKTAKELKACHKAWIGEYLTRGHTEVVYWSTVVFIMVLAMIVGVVYSETHQEYKRFKRQEQIFKDLGSPEEEREKFDKATKDHDGHARYCLCTTLISLTLVLLADTIQVSVIIALHHCQREDLIGLYWPVWTVIGLGSLVAMLGVVITQIYGLRGHSLPPFSVALGTPLLVVCSIGHLIFTKYKKWRKSRNKNHDTDLEAFPEDGCKLVLSRDNGPIFQIWSSAGELPKYTSGIGKTSAGFWVLEYTCPEERNCKPCSRRIKILAPEHEGPSQNGATSASQTGVDTPDEAGPQNKVQGKTQAQTQTQDKAVPRENP